MKPNAAATRRFCTFYIQGRFFGVDVTQIQEVIRSQDMTPVPLVSAVIQGLVNLRGQIVTAVDLRKRLGLPDRQAGQTPMNVVVRTPDGAVSLLVDAIGDVLEVGEDAFEPAPETLEGAARQMVLGAYKLKDSLLLVLDTGKALTLEGIDKEKRAPGPSEGNHVKP